MSLLRIEASDEALDALMDCLTLGISEAIGDAIMDRPFRVSLVDACTAFHIAEQMQKEIVAGRKDTCTGGD